jgi:predicted RNase H-like HicB family nuclease
MEAAGLTVARRGWGSAKILVMPRFTVEIIPDLEYGGFTARVPDIPAYGEGATEDEAMADLREAVAAYVEAFGMEDARARLNQPISLRELDLELEDPVRA